MIHQAPCSKDLQPKTPPGERALNFSLFILCLFPIVVSALITSDGTLNTLHILDFPIPLRGICFFKLLTGYRCPVCGMTRCFSYMSHGQIAEAWHMSHAGIAVYFLCIYECIYRLSRLILGKFKFFKVFKAIETILIVITCFAIVFFFIAQFINTALIV